MPLRWPAGMGRRCESMWRRAGSCVASRRCRGNSRSRARAGRDVQDTRGDRHLLSWESGELLPGRRKSATVRPPGQRARRDKPPIARHLSGRGRKLSRRFVRRGAARRPAVCDSVPFTERSTPVPRALFQLSAALVVPTRSGTHQSHWCPTSNVRAFSLATLVVAFLLGPACILRPGMNANCTCSPASASALDLAKRADQRHLVLDAELLEGLVDRYRFHPPDEQRQCEQKLIAVVDACTRSMSVTSFGPANAFPNEDLTCP